MTATTGRSAERRRIEKTLAGLNAGKPMADVADPDGFEELVGMEAWVEIEEKFGKG
jgi:hypothetical protein